MLRTELLADGRIRHYSDSGVMIRQVETGALCVDAVDVTPLRYTYNETDERIPEREPTVEDKAEAYDILVGGAT